MIVGSVALRGMDEREGGMRRRMVGMDNNIKHDDKNSTNLSVSHQSE
jgi:hypothetical protein